MTYLRDEIASQPSVWSRALEMSVSGLPEPGIQMGGCGFWEGFGHRLMYRKR